MGKDVHKRRQTVLPQGTVGTPCAACQTACHADTGTTSLHTRTEADTTVPVIGTHGSSCVPATQVLVAAAAMLREKVSTPLPAVCTTCRSEQGEAEQFTCTVRLT